MRLLAWKLRRAFLDALIASDLTTERFRRLLMQRSGAKVSQAARVRPGLRLIGDWSDLEIGDVFINEACLFDITEARLTLGDGVDVAHGVKILGTTHDIGSASRRAGLKVNRPIEVGAGVWIGAGAVILAGVSIGTGAVIAAGAVVNKDVASDVLVGGVPARFIHAIDL